MSGLLVILLIFAACKILFSRDVRGGIGDTEIWTPSPFATGLKSLLRIVIVFFILAFLMMCCAGV